MPRKSDTDLKAILQAEKNDALAAIRASKLSTQRSDAMDYYMGDMTKDMPAEDGRSRAVSTDVADTVEGLMPSLMEIFAGTEEVVKFNPVGPEDEGAAEQETDYVNHVFMNENPGFLILYSFIKDALLSKVGVVKVWWEETEVPHRETYYDQPDDAFALILANPGLEVIAHSERPDPTFPANPELDEDEQQIPHLHDVTVLTTKIVKKARVMGVPPEEFGISRHARDLPNCGYCFHEVPRRQADIIADGYDADQIDSLPTYTMLTNPEELARDTVDEHLSAGGDEGANRDNRLIKITEHHIRMDYEGDGRAQYYRVTTGGDQGEILERDGKSDIEDEDGPPFAAMTPFIMTHRFFGRSVADRIMDIQRIKTALVRGILDNTYAAVKPRVEIAESHASENTLDDLLVSRHGGIIRTKQPGGLNWQTVPAIAGELAPVLEYWDAAREWRTGVSRAGQGLDPDVLQNQSATAASQLFTAAQAQMKLIARVFAETGIKDLFALLHGIIRKHGDKAHTVRLRNKWVTVDPRDWNERNDMTINVGLGTGSKAEQMAMMTMIGNAQKEILAGGLSNVVTPDNVYNTAKEMAKIAGQKNPDLFFTNPNGQAPAQKPNPEMLKIQAEMEANQQKVAADAAHQKLKTEADIAQQAAQFDFDKQLAMLQHELKMKEVHAGIATNVIKAATVTRKVGLNGETETSVDRDLINHVLGGLENINRKKPMRVVYNEAGRPSHLEPMG